MFASLVCYCCCLACFLLQGCSNDPSGVNVDLTGDRETTSGPASTPTTTVTSTARSATSTQTITTMTSTQTSTATSTTSRLPQCDASACRAHCFASDDILCAFAGQWDAIWNGGSFWSRYNISANGTVHEQQGSGDVNGMSGSWSAARLRGTLRREPNDSKCPRVVGNQHYEGGAPCAKTTCFDDIGSAIPYGTCPIPSSYSASDSRDLMKVVGDHIFINRIPLSSFNDGPLQSMGEYAFRQRSVRTGGASVCGSSMACDTSACVC